MSREIDRRDFSVSKIKQARADELSALASKISNTLPGKHRVRIRNFDAATGNPSLVVSESAPAEKGNYIQRALDHVHNLSRALGLAATQPAEFVADPHIQKTSRGAVTVHLQQQYKGIRIFEAAEAVRFAPDGRLKETAGHRVTVERDLPISPKLSAEDAVLKAAQHVAVPHEDEKNTTDHLGLPLNLSSVDVTDFEPKVMRSFPENPEQPTTLEPGPFEEPIQANLIWFHQDRAVGEAVVHGQLPPDLSQREAGGDFSLREVARRPVRPPDDLKLTWEVLITMPNYEGQYRTLVDAETGEILYCRQLIQTVAARGNVFLVDGGGERQMVNFPKPLEDYGLPIPDDLPDGFPDNWVTADKTEGNSVSARLVPARQPIKGTEVEGVLTFNPDDPESNDQAVVNLFYFNCCMHDYFYLLGFREADGNFQEDNFDRGGRPKDPVQAHAHQGPVPGGANMLTLPDGVSGLMNMGTVPMTGRHTALDSTIVFHEFSHGVTNRLVGGPMNPHALGQPQSGGMGEGWGDYFACTINNTTTVGAWAMDKPGGFRRFPYDSHYPGNFGDLGTDDYKEVHNIGEIWCATLLEMNREIGVSLGVQLVVDALKLSPANPSFLDMRDSILTALNDELETGQLNDREYDDAWKGIWKAFAKFGMGPNAVCNGASLSGIVADFSVPESPETPIPERPQAPSRFNPFGLLHALLALHTPFGHFRASLAPASRDGMPGESL